MRRGTYSGVCSSREEKPARNYVCMVHITSIAQFAQHNDTVYMDPFYRVKYHNTRVSGIIGIKTTV